MTESKQWTLKDLTASTGFQQLENELRKENGGSGGLVSDLEKTLDHVRRLENKVEEIRPGPSSSFTVKEWRQDPETTKHLPNFAPKVQHRLPEKKVEIDRPDAPIFRSVKEQPVRLYLYLIKHYFHYPSLSQASDHRFVEKKVEEPAKPNAFRTAKDQLVSLESIRWKLHPQDLHKNVARYYQIVDQRKKNAGGSNAPPPSYNSRPKSLGTRRGLNSPFILPIKGAQPPEEEQKPSPNELDKITGYLLNTYLLNTLLNI